MMSSLRRIVAQSPSVESTSPKPWLLKDWPLLWGRITLLHVFWWRNLSLLFSMLGILLTMTAVRPITMTFWQLRTRPQSPTMAYTTKSTCNRGGSQTFPAMWLKAGSFCHHCKGLAGCRFVLQSFSLWGHPTQNCPKTCRPWSSLLRQDLDLGCTFPARLAWSHFCYQGKKMQSGLISSSISNVTFFQHQLSTWSQSSS